MRRRLRCKSLRLEILRCTAVVVVLGRENNLLSYHVGEAEADDELMVALVGGIHDVIDWQTHDHVVAIFICCKYNLAAMI